VRSAICETVRQQFTESSKQSYIEDDLSMSDSVKGNAH
jgi:hypothetical protein